MKIGILTEYCASSTTRAGDVVQMVVMTEEERVAYRHVASAAVAVAAAVHTSVPGVDSSETMRAGLAQPQRRLAARHPASFRPS